MTALSVGIDLVQVSRIAESLERFGERFLRRVFTEDEITYARTSPTQMVQRLAARFAAKEATIKALRLAEFPINWREIEVRRTASGACEMALHGTLGLIAAQSGHGELAVSLSHEGDYATAVVVSCIREAHN
ncbi:MAG: holo-ACP synthase [Gemmatimonadaceae bacterium]